ncbi:NADH-quinone oxidoreductase subunit C [Desulfovermiculus halophilus]|jgi:NADH-quinone oxidoreductase subunit C|uniref:NADH-quinone oxidoreductase subunit C n=1 Tax=Desulfovermiculus halophilus TaxID=339722 RepID=UPI00068451AB|nr:NADH-quinone oxidoreductase subunit C [Desulfovermiculus halophilus]
MDNSQVLAAVTQGFPQAVASSDQPYGQLHLTLNLKGDDLLAFMRFLRDDPALRYTMLTDITATDWTPRTPRFDLVYILYSIANTHRLVLHLAVAEDEPVPSVAGVWRSANWGEREVYDLMGIHFLNHPDLRRILTWDSFEGHPLRKDFPLHGNYDVDDFDFHTLEVNSAFASDIDQPCRIPNALE